jgi:MFS family permease
VLRPYRDLLSTPGGLAFSAAGFVARMPISMMGLGLVLLVAGRTGRYGVAGGLSATFALVNALSAPLIARMVDRRGQRRVLVPAVSVHAVFLLGCVAVVSAGAPVWTWFATAAVAGLAAPSIGSLVRARWGYVLGADPRLQTAYSLESVLDELIFVVGPLLVTVLATQVADQAGLLAALALLVGGTALFLAQRGTEPPPAPGRHHLGSALRSPGLPLVTTVMAFIGGVFGGVEISTIAFADRSGHPALAGPLLAAYALGSMLAGLVYGAVRWRAPLARRFLLGVSVMTATVVVLPFVRHPGVLAACLFVAGVGIAPTLISGLSLVERMVPPSMVTEGLTWATTGLVVGLSLASAVAGRLVDRLGAGPAFAVAAVSGAAAVAVCGVGFRRLHRHATAPREFLPTGRARLPGGAAEGP